MALLALWSAPLTGNSEFGQGASLVVSPLSWTIRRLRRWKQRHRRAGDEARARRDWAQAATFYRRHLASAPADGAIAIQYGHALKESGRLREALAAYETALTITPADDEVLRHAAQVHRLLGQRGEAFRLLQQSAALRPGGSADTDLAALVDDPTGGATPRRWVDAAGLAAIAARCVGIVPVAAADLHAAAGIMEPLSDDPWIEFVPDDALEQSALGELTVEIEPSIGSAGQLYLDHGSGFSERDVVVLASGMPAALLGRPGSIVRLRWDPPAERGPIDVVRIAVTPVTDMDDARRRIGQYGLSTIATRASVAAAERVLSSAVMTDAELGRIQRRLPPVGQEELRYERWIEAQEKGATATFDDETAGTDLDEAPLFSIVIPVYNPPVDLLHRCLESVLAQSHGDFEVCLADDASTSSYVRLMLQDYAARDARIRIVWRERNGHIAAASNSAVALARGRFIVLLDQDDEIPSFALAVASRYIGAHPDASIFFSDEDKIDLDGTRHSPYLKGEFDRFLMFGHNMISHLGIYRRALVSDVGGFRMGLDGSQDYDLFWRCYERVGDAGVVHIPHVLYHWRVVPGSTAMGAEQKSYAHDAARAAINGHLERTATPLRSVPGFAPGVSGVTDTRERSASVSVIIPTRDRADLLAACLTSLYTGSGAEDVEIIVVDNGSTAPAMTTLLDERRRDGSIAVVSAPGPFNFSRIVNQGVGAARGDILCLLNDDIEMLDDRWLQRSRMLLALSDVGVVGARLLYPNGVLQHAGIGLGMADHRVAMALGHGLDAREPGYFGKSRLLRQVGAVTAACLFIRRSVYQAQGGLDEALPVAYNDIDLCLRVRAAGLKVLYDPEIAAIHHESASRGYEISDEKRARLACDAAVMRERWQRELDADPFLSPHHSRDDSLFTLAEDSRFLLP